VDSDTAKNRLASHAHARYAKNMMKISFSEIHSAECLESTELKVRAIKSSKSPKTKHYRVIVDGIEAAFLSLDRWPEPQVSQMVVYEIFVPSSMRRKGIASAVLAEVELLAIKEGFQKMHLRPEPLDSETSKAELIEWYSRRGYNWDPAVFGDMGKPLSN